MKNESLLYKNNLQTYVSDFAIYLILCLTVWFCTKKPNKS